ncbi:MAG: nuclear transport factor 2 family protein [Steroidobacteraceae bacterium]
MLKQFSMALLLLLVAAAAAQLPTASVEAEIRAVEQAQVKAALAGNRLALEKIFAPDFRMISPTGAVASRAELLALLASGTPPYRAAVYTTDSLLPYDRVVITTGTESVEYASDGRRQQRRITQVWEKHGSGWHLVLRQATLVAPP